MPIVTQLRNPALGVGWLAAGLGWPPSPEAPGSVHVPSSTSRLSWTPCRSDGRKEARTSRILQGDSSLSLETVRHPFSQLLSAKASHQARPDPRGRESDSTALVRSAVTWQRMPIGDRMKTWCK